MSSAKLTINNLNGSKGGLVINNAFVDAYQLTTLSGQMFYHAHLNRLYDINNSVNQEDDYIFYYNVACENFSVNNLILGIIEYQNDYNSAFYFGNKKTSTPFLALKNDRITCESFSTLTTNKDSYLGRLYCKIDEVGGTSLSFKEWDQDSCIDTFHSFLSVKQCSGEKLNIEVGGSSTYDYYLLDFGYFYCIEGSYNDNKIKYKIIINFLSAFDQDEGLKMGTSLNDFNTVAEFYNTTEKTQIYFFTPAQKECKITGVYKLPLKINSMGISGQRSSVIQESTNMLVSKGNLKWNFNCLSETNVTCGSVDIDVKATYSFDGGGNSESTRTYTFEGTDLTLETWYEGKWTQWTGLSYQSGTCTYKLSVQGDYLVLHCSELPDAYNSIDKKTCKIYCVKIINEDYYNRYE
jgi:hypothetical protein